MVSLALKLNGSAPDSANVREVMRNSMALARLLTATLAGRLLNAAWTVLAPDGWLFVDQSNGYCFVTDG
jgi:hypothetical protein